MARKQEIDHDEDDSFDLEEVLDPETTAAPLHWRAPKIHPEIVAHGAELARLAIEMARLERSQGKTVVSPLECLEAAGMLFQRAMDMVPATVNLSRPDRQEYDAWIRDQIADKTTRKPVPWAVICSEGQASNDARKTSVNLIIDGKTVSYEWKAYVQLEKEGGLKALLFKHAMRVCFQEKKQKWMVGRLKRILTVWAFHHQRRLWDKAQREAWWNHRLDKKRRGRALFESKLQELNEFQIKDLVRTRAEKLRRQRRMRRIVIVWRQFDMEWTAPFFREAMNQAQNSPWTCKEGRNEVLKSWQQLSAKDFASRLLKWAQAGELRAADFKAIALTRKMNPPGGRQRGISCMD